MPPTNIYHIGMGRSGKTWIRLLFGYKLRGTPFGRCKELEQLFVRYEKVPGINKFTGRKMWEGLGRRPLRMPPNMILVGLGCRYSDFLKMKKSEDFRGILLLRDPRQVFWSVYHSWIGAHLGGHPKGRLVKGKNLTDSLRVVLNDREIRRMFEWTLTWSDCQDDRVMRRRFEDVFASDDAQVKFVKDIFDFLEMPVTVDQFNRVINFLRFDRITNGRKRGEVDNKHQFRSGSSDTWKEKLPAVILDELQERFGHVIEGLGYEIHCT